MSWGEAFSQTRWQAGIFAGLFFLISLGIDLLLFEQLYWAPLIATVFIASVIYWTAIAWWLKGKHD